MAASGNLLTRLFASTIGQMRAAAFLKRSIRQDSRLLSHHVLRAVMPVIILYLFIFQLQLFSVKGSSGGSFADWVMTCCYWFLTVVGGVHFSTAIVEEKEEQTLPLLRMTGVPTFAILTGKSIPRLMLAVLFVVVIAPFLILSLTLGGVLPLGLVSGIVSIICYAVMLSQIGLFASVIGRNATQAFTLTCVVWAVIELSHWWIFLATFGGGLQLGLDLTGFWLVDQVIGFVNYLLGNLSEISLKANLSTSLLAFTTIDAGPDASFWDTTKATIWELWSFRLGFQLCVAAFFFCLSWACFEPFTNREVVVTSKGSTVQSKSRRPTTRVWRNALQWKSWQLIAGGDLWFWLRLIALPLFVVLTICILMLVLADEIELEAVGWLSFVLGLFIFMINLFRLFGRVLNVEIHGKTLPALVMLPRSTARTIWDLVLGTIPSTLAGGSCAAFGFCTVLLVGMGRNGSILEIFEVLLEPWFWHFFSLLILTIHLGLLLTTYFRYGGMLVAVALVFVGTILFSVTVAMFAFGFSGMGGDDMVEYVLPLLLIMIEVALCVVLERAILSRMIELAAR